MCVFTVGHRPPTQPRSKETTMSPVCPCTAARGCCSRTTGPGQPRWGQPSGGSPVCSAPPPWQCWWPRSPVEALQLLLVHPGLSEVNRLSPVTRSPEDHLGASCLQAPAQVPLLQEVFTDWPLLRSWLWRRGSGATDKVAVCREPPPRQDMRASLGSALQGALVRMCGQRQHCTS